MKKLLILLIPVLCLSFLNKTEAYEIPSEAIRLRVLANTNSDYDLQVKFKVSNKIQDTMYNLLKDTKDIGEARKIIKDNLDIIDNDIEKVLQVENYPYGYNIDYGYNYFPKKEYKGVIYKEGEYESILVTLGKGEGDNWWCVLFPPLCLLDEQSDLSNAEYSFYVSEVINKFK